MAKPISKQNFSLKELLALDALAKLYNAKEHGNYGKDGDPVYKLNQLRLRDDLSAGLEISSKGYAEFCQEKLDAIKQKLKSATFQEVKNETVEKALGARASAIANFDSGKFGAFARWIEKEVKVYSKASPEEITLVTDIKIRQIKTAEAKETENPFKDLAKPSLERTSSNSSGFSDDWNETREEEVKNTAKLKNMKPESHQTQTSLTKADKKGKTHGTEQGQTHGAPGRN